MAQKTIFGEKANEEVLQKQIAKFKGEIMIQPNKVMQVEPSEKTHSFRSSFADIEGTITLKSKDAAIFFVQHIIDEFDIEREELSI